MYVCTHVCMCSHSQAAPVVSLYVNRQEPLSSMVSSLDVYTGDDILHGKVNVLFRGEEGTVLNRQYNTIQYNTTHANRVTIGICTGPRREFIDVLSSYLSDPENGLFAPSNVCMCEYLYSTSPHHSRSRISPCSLFRQSSIPKAFHAMGALLLKES